MTLAMGMVHGELKRKNVRQASFFQWCPSAFNSSFCMVFLPVTSRLSPGFYTISGHRTKRVHTYAQQSLAYQAHQNLHMWYMKTLTIFVAKASPNHCSSIEQVSPRVNSTQEFWSRYRWCWQMKALIPPCHAVAAITVAIEEVSPWLVSFLTTIIKEIDSSWL